MKKKIAIIVLFILCLVMPTISWPIMHSSLNIDLNENRKLRDFPKMTDGFIMDFENYFLDHAPYRSINIKVNNGVDKWLANIYSNILNGLNISYYQSKNNVLFGEDDWLFYLGDNSLGCYTGSNLPTKEELSNYVEKVNILDNYFKSQNKELVIFIAPNKEQIYYDYMPKGIKIVNKIKRCDVIYNYFKQYSSVKYSYPKEELLTAKKDNQLYYKYDTHWNVKGATIGAMNLFKTLNLNIPTIKTNKTSRMGGDLTNMLAEKAKPDVEFVEDFSNIQAEHIQDKHLLLIGDSFRVAMRKTISKVYPNSTFHHRAEYNNSQDYKDLINNSDVIVLQAVERYESSIFGDGGMVDRMIADLNIPIK